MGIFDSLFGGMSGGGALSSHEAYAGILLGASACDGHIADEEVQGLVVALVRMKLFERVNDKQFDQILNKVHKIQKTQGVDALIDACVPALPRDLVNAAFTNACDIVLADGVVEQDEKIFMDKLQLKLGIDANTAKTIVQVMIIKNKG